MNGIPFYILAKHLGSERTVKILGSTETNYLTGEVSQNTITRTLTVVLLTNKSKSIFSQSREVETYDLRIVTGEPLTRGDIVIIDDCEFVIKGLTEYTQFNGYLIYLEKKES